MGRAKFRTPPPPKPLDQFGCRYKYITTSPQGVDVQNLVKIDLAVAALRMREKTRFRVGFLANVNSRSRSLYAIARPSVCRLSVCL